MGRIGCAGPVFSSMSSSGAGGPNEPGQRGGGSLAEPRAGAQWSLAFPPCPPNHRENPRPGRRLRSIVDRCALRLRRRGSIATPGCRRCGRGNTSASMSPLDGTVVVSTPARESASLGGAPAGRRDRPILRSLRTPIGTTSSAFRSSPPSGARNALILYPLATAAGAAPPHSILFEEILFRCGRRTSRQGRAHRPSRKRWRIGSAVVSASRLNHPAARKASHDDADRPRSLPYDNELAPPGPPPPRWTILPNSRATSVCSSTTRNTSNRTCRSNAGGGTRW